MSAGVGSSGAAAGGKLEERVDLTKETDDKIAQATQLTVEAGRLSDGLALLAALEKRCRVGNDNASLARVCSASLELCRKANDHEELIHTLNTLATRRSQKTAAIRSLVQTAMPWCVTEPYSPLACANQAETDFRDKLVVALRDISDGKIFLERERAVLTRVLATIKVRAAIFRPSSREVKNLAWWWGASTSHTLFLSTCESPVFNIKMKRNKRGILPPRLMCCRRSTSKRTAHCRNAIRSNSSWSR